MITISQNNLHLLLGVLHLGSIKNERGICKCCCEHQHEGLSTVDREISDNYSWGNSAIMSEHDYDAILDIAYGHAKDEEDRGVKMTTLSHRGCIPTRFILRAVEKMIATSEIVVVD